MQRYRGMALLLVPQSLPGPTSLCSQSSVGCVYPRLLDSPTLCLSLRKHTSMGRNGRDLIMETT